MHTSIEQMPIKMEAPGTSIRSVEGWGGMAAAVLELPAGTDLGPMLEGLPDDACTGHHWGYVVKGKITVTNKDESEEALEAGELCHLLPGHSATVQEDVVFLEFTPEAEFKQVIDHILAKAGS